MERKPYPPGEHGRGRIRDSEYLASSYGRSRRARRIYGLLEKQFRNLLPAGIEAEGRHWRGVAPDARVTLRQCRVPCQLSGQPQPGPPDGPARPRDGERQAGDDSVVPGPQGRRRRRCPPRRRRTSSSATTSTRSTRTVPMWLDASKDSIEGHGPRAAAPRADRRARPRAAHRRALLQVAPGPPVGWAEKIDSKGTQHAHHPAPRSGSRRSRRPHPVLRDLAARARLRPHARQQPAAHAALVDPGRGRHARCASTRRSTSSTRSPG